MRLVDRGDLAAESRSSRRTLPRSSRRARLRRRYLGRSLLARLASLRLGHPGTAY